MTTEGAPRKDGNLWSRAPLTIRIGLLAALLLFIAAGLALLSHRYAKRNGRGSASDTLPRQPIQISVGKVRPPLPYRIVSFHKGRADKKLIRLAAQLGFNGVQIQLEGSTVDGIRQFARYDSKEHLVDFCHQLGMKVTVWVHELSDVPPPWMPEWLGPVSATNAPLISLLESRYEWALRDAIPNIDGLVLTVVETQVRATDSAVMLKIADLIHKKCDKYKKSLIVRTFVWYPEEFANVMSAVNQLPADTIIMSKCVPQDWQMRGGYAAEIGNVGGRPQIIEYDVCGEYFLRDNVANCMPDLLKQHFDYETKHNISGICVRVDRDTSSVLHEPSEVNLWALGMLAAGATDNVEEIWTAWATNRFGKPAAAGVVRALKPTQGVISELLSIGPFTFGDTRKFPPLADEEVFRDNWQNWWWDKAYVLQRDQAEAGDAAFVGEVAASKAHALQQADLCLADLELVKEKLTVEDYAILKTGLLSNKAQLEFRTPMAMAVLHYNRKIQTDDDAERDAMDEAMQADLARLRALARPIPGPQKELVYLGRTWKIGSPPEILSREAIYYWAYQMDLLRQGIDPRPAARGPKNRPNRASTGGTAR